MRRALSGSLLTFFAYASTLIVSALYFRSVAGYSAGGVSGLLIAPALTLAAATRIGGAGGWTGRGNSLRLALLGVAAGSGALGLAFAAHSTAAAVAALSVVCATVGLAHPILARRCYEVAGEHAGTVGALQQAAIQLGTAAGTSLFGAVIAGRTSSGPGALAAVVVAIVVLCAGAAVGGAVRP